MGNSFTALQRRMSKSMLQAALRPGQADLVRSLFAYRCLQSLAMAHALQPTKSGATTRVEGQSLREGALGDAPQRSTRPAKACKSLWRARLFANTSSKLLQKFQCPEDPRFDHLRSQRAPYSSVDAKALRHSPPVACKTRTGHRKLGATEVTVKLNLEAQEPEEYGELRADLVCQECGVSGGAPSRRC